MLNKRLDKICGFSLLVIFLLFMGSTLFFNHTHVSDSNIIVHSHPFKPDNDGKPRHNHNNYSYILVHVLNNFITSTTSPILIASLFLFLAAELLQKVNVFHHSGNRIIQYPQRGPPSLMILD